MQKDPCHRESDQNSDETIKQSSRSSAFHWFTQQIIKMVIRWIIKHIDIQLEDIQIIVRDCDVLFQFNCYYI